MWQKKDDLGEVCKKLKRLKETVKSILANNMENTSENISVKNMNDYILDAVLKVVKVDI